MRFVLFAPLFALAACSGGGTGVSQSDFNDLGQPPGTDILHNPPDDTTGGDVSFTLLLNDARVAGGVMELTLSSELTAAAGAHAADMVANDYLSHTGLDGSSPGDRALEAGYDYTFIAENIARGFETEQGVMDGWMASESHMENILDPRAEDFGLGRTEDTWVLMLGAEY